MMSSSTVTEKLHFKGLNGIRAIAALLVLIAHINQFINLFKLESGQYFFTGMASYAVTLFFVLSGYLITYLLLKEKEKYNSISFKDFYIRRILRIWPVYYGVIILALSLIIIVPALQANYPNLTKTFIYYSLFIANIGYALNLGFITITPLWSVGSEEQFYLFWPILVNYSEKILHTLTAFAIIFILTKLALRIFENGFFYSMMGYFSFDAMAIGGIGAYWVYSNDSKLKIIYNFYLQLAAWAFFIFSCAYKPIHIASVLDSEIHACVYLIMIINVSTNPKTILSLENVFFNYIGKISYGIYVYHMTIIYVIYLFLGNFMGNMENKLLAYCLTYILVTIFTIAFAASSYWLMETKILSFKEKFQRVKSST